VHRSPWWGRLGIVAVMSVAGCSTSTATRHDLLDRSESLGITAYALPEHPELGILRVVVASADVSERAASVGFDTSRLVDAYVTNILSASANFRAPFKKNRSA